MAGARENLNPSSSVPHYVPRYIIFASRGQIRDARGTRGHTFDIKGAAIPG